MADNEKQIAAMRKLGMSEQEIADLLTYDKRVDRGADDYKLTSEQEKASKDARKKMGASHRTVYKLDNTGGKRSRKENLTKATLIADLAKFVKTIAENVEVPNKERMITFECNGNKYDLTLIQKRKPKAGAE